MAKAFASVHSSAKQLVIYGQHQLAVLAVIRSTVDLSIHFDTTPVENGDRLTLSLAFVSRLSANRLSAEALWSFVPHTERSQRSN